MLGTHAKSDEQMSRISLKQVVYAKRVDLERPNGAHMRLWEVGDVLNNWILLQCTHSLKHHAIYLQDVHLQFVNYISGRLWENTTPRGERKT